MSYISEIVLKPQAAADHDVGVGGVVAEARREVPLGPGDDGLDVELVEQQVLERAEGLDVIEFPDLAVAVLVDVLEVGVVAAAADQETFDDARVEKAARAPGGVAGGLGPRQ